MGFWRLPNACRKSIAFAHYPPRSDTSHDGGLVGLNESQQLHVLLFIMLADCYITF
jgi:predicted phosphohydrolase